MKNKTKSSKDTEFKPKQIKIRQTYRKLKAEVKDELAQLYYIQKFKMSKLVKKFRISFSTLTDILKKYNVNGEKLNIQLQNSQVRQAQLKLQQDNFGQEKDIVKIEEFQGHQPIIMEQCYQHQYTPQYIFYAS